MDHGLPEKTISAIQGVLTAFPQVEKAILYGSRAKGNYQRGSDIDLALFGDELSDRLISRIYWALDDLLLPYKIDLSHFAKLKHERLVEHIQSAGISIYDRAGQEAAL
ncbi:MAG TPA: nucleotidyltransferase domain-containing protein [Chthoniobacterales bacterium]|jgi:predicted nucleotidyltransferase